MSEVREWPDIWQALEVTALAPTSTRLDSSTVASKRTVVNHRDTLMRFLTEVEGDMTVAEVREALEEYI